MSNAEGSDQGLEYSVRGFDDDQWRAAIDVIWKNEVLTSAEFKDAAAATATLKQPSSLFELDTSQGTDPGTVALIVLAAHTGISIGKTIVLDAWKKIVLPALQRKFGTDAIKQSRSKR